MIGNIYIENISTVPVANEVSSQFQVPAWQYGDGKTPFVINNHTSPA